MTPVTLAGPFASILLFLFLFLQKVREISKYLLRLKIRAINIRMENKSPFSLLRDLSQISDLPDLLDLLIFPNLCDLCLRDVRDRA